MSVRSRISVALCTYNGAAYLPVQLASIAAQQRCPDEVVIVDDASHDASVELVRAFAAAAPFPVRIFVNETNRGSVGSFERAIAACDGEIIVLADQDDRWRADKLATIEQAMADPSVGLVFSDAQLVDEQLASLGTRLWERIEFTPREQRRFAHDRGFEVLLYRSVVTGATAAFRSDFRSVILPMPSLEVGVWTHDGWIALLVAAYARVVPIAEPLIDYRQHARQQVGAVVQRPGSLTRRLALARERRRSGFKREHRHYQWAYERLQAFQAGLPADQLRLIAAKIAFLAERTTLPEARLRRIGPVWRNLRRRRYQQFGAGIRSALADILL